MLEILESNIYYLNEIFTFTKNQEIKKIKNRLTPEELRNVMAGKANNRQCMIYGALTFLSLPSGWGAMAGLWYMNSEGCFND